VGLFDVIDPRFEPCLEREEAMVGDPGAEGRHICGTRQTSCFGASKLHAGFGAQGGRARPHRRAGQPLSEERR
jgi:hypothetical protein